MNYFYKIPTKFEDKNPVCYINLMAIQEISIEVEYTTTNIGYLKLAYLVINGTKHLYDSVSILVKKQMTIKEIEENDKKDLEFKRIQTRLKMIVQDIIERTQLCRQKSNEVKIEKPKILKEEREDDAKEIVKKIEEYCEFKFVNFYGEKDEVALAGLHEIMVILKIIHPDESMQKIRNKIKQKFEPNNQSKQDGLDALR